MRKSGGSWPVSVHMMAGKYSLKGRCLHGSLTGRAARCKGKPAWRISPGDLTVYG